MKTRGGFSGSKTVRVGSCRSILSRKPQVITFSHPAALFEMMFSQMNAKNVGCLTLRRLLLLLCMCLEALARYPDCSSLVLRGHFGLTGSPTIARILPLPWFLSFMFCY